MSNIFTHDVKLSGLAENLDNFYQQIKDLVLLNQNLYQIVFGKEVNIDDWGSEWIIFHSKVYEYGDFSMEIVCESETEPSFGFWQIVSKEFDLIVEIYYFDLDEYYNSMVFNDGEIVNSEKISSLEYLYYNDRDSFWLECVDDKWSSIEELLYNLNSISPYFRDGELKRIQEIFENKIK